MHACFPQCPPIMLYEQERGEVFRDPATGAVFAKEPSESPERDKWGELAFRPISYTPWPVKQGEEGGMCRGDWHLSSMHVLAAPCRQWQHWRPALRRFRRAWYS